MWAVRKGHVVVLKSDAIGLALSVDGEVLHVPGVVTVGTIEPVFLALRIEVPSGRFEVRTFALGNLVKVDGVLSGRQVVQVQFDPDTRSLLPQGSRTNVLSLCIDESHFELNLGLSCASERHSSYSEKSEGETSEPLHDLSLLEAAIIANPPGPVVASGWAIRASR